MGGEADDDGATARDATADTTSERGGTPSRPSKLALTGDRYRVAERLALGGMGEVMHAFDVQIGREVAIKRMRHDAPSKRAVERFTREATIQGRLDHPSIVPVYELGRDVDGRPYFAMKKLAGTTLAEILIGDHADRRRLLRAFVDVCLAVEFAHQRGVIHRDLKPENIMLGDFGETYVLDWGVAKVSGLEEAPLDDEEPARPDVTAAGTVIGTPGYMPPEQARGETNIDERCDVYALGCILFEVLAGQRLHPRGKDGLVSALLGAADNRPSRRAADRDVPPELDDLCAAATAQSRADRIATARELADRVQRYLDGDRDLSVRHALAEEHLQAATAAFTAGDHTSALRGAARALALDPRMPGAAELVTRVMLEPPAHVPVEIESELDDDGDRVVRRVGKRIALTNLAYLLFVPFLFGRIAPVYIALLLAIVGVKIAVTWGMIYWGTVRVRYARLALNMAMLALVVRLSSPILFAPGIAAVTAVGLMSGTFRSVRDGILVGLGLTLSVFVPWALEVSGVLSPTMTFGDGTLMLHSPMLVDLGTGYFGVALSTGTLIAVAIITTHGLRLAERASRRRVRVQAWQLRQLVPS